jgi:hypothetical protein
VRGGLLLHQHRYPVHWLPRRPWWSAATGIAATASATSVATNARQIRTFIAFIDVQFSLKPFFLVKHAFFFLQA